MKERTESSFSDPRSPNDIERRLAEADQTHLGYIYCQWGVEVAAIACREVIARQGLYGALCMYPDYPEVISLAVDPTWTPSWEGGPAGPVADSEAL